MIRMPARVALVAAAFPIVVLAGDTKFTSTCKPKDSRQLLADLVDAAAKAMKKPGSASSRERCLAGIGS